MVLVDAERHYVAVNDAAADLYRLSQEEIVGVYAGGRVPDRATGIADETWAELVRTGEFYGERVVRGSSGPALRLVYAAHATTLDERWAALFVVLSAQLEPKGEELIGAVRPAPGSDASREEAAAVIPHGKGLTPRELEIVQRVALGRSTPQIAADLNLSPATVRSHVRNAMVKTGAHTRAQLVAMLLGDGLARE